MGLFGGGNGDDVQIQVNLDAVKAIEEVEKIQAKIEALGKSSGDNSEKVKLLEDALKGLAKEADKARADVDKLNEKGTTLGNVLGGMRTGLNVAGQAAVIAGGALLTVSGIASALIVKFVEAGDKLGDLKGSFENLGGSSKSIEDANKAILGVLPNIELYRLANKGLVAEIPDFNKNFAQIAEYGKKVGESLGIDTAQGIEQVTQALISGRDVALKQVGIFIDQDKASKDYAQSMGIVGRQLTENEKKYANQIAATDALLRKNKELGEGGDSVADALDAVSSSFTDQIGIIGLAINENNALTGAVRTFEGVIDGLDLTEFTTNLTDLAGEFAQVGADAVVAGVDMVNNFARGLRIVGELANQTGAALEPLMDAVGAYGRLMRGDVLDLDNYKKIVGALGKVELPSFQKAVEKVNAEMAEKNEITKVAIAEAKGEQQTIKAKAQALKLAGDQQDAYNKSLEAGKKAEEEFLKEMQKAEEAFKQLNQDIDTITRENNLEKLQDDLKKAFELKDFTKAGTVRETIRAQIREGIVQGYLDAGGEIDDQANKLIDEKTDLELGKMEKGVKDGIEKGVKDGFLQSELPNYLSEMITGAITTGFTEGFSNETLKSAGNSLSSIFAQEFQNSFQKLFSGEKGGGFTKANIYESLSNLGLSYGLTTLTANATDKEKDVKGGITSGAITGASIGTMILPGWGTAIGAGVGAVGGYFVGASGPSTNSDTKQRHETINFIEGLIDNKHLSFLQEQGNIIEGYNYRFNQRIDNPWWRGAMNSIHAAPENLPVYQFENQAFNGNGPVAGAINVSNDTIHPAIMGQTQYGGPTSGIGSIGGPGWADQYWEQFGQVGGESFGALGAAFSEMAGQMGPTMEQVGVIIAENLGGNLDNARMLLQTLGVGAEDLEQSFMNIGLAGEESWHTVETWMQRIPELTGEGLIGIGDLEGAMNQFINSGGRGQEALISLRNIGIEAMESGASSMDDLRNHLIATGKFTTEQISALMGGLAQRGITSLQDIKDASDRTLGGVTADAESLGFAWSDSIGQGLADSIDDVEKLKSVISDLPDTIEKNITLKVKTEYSGDDAKALYSDLRNNVGVARA